MSQSFKNNSARWLNADHFASEIRLDFPQSCLVMHLDFEVPAVVLDVAIPLAGDLPSEEERLANPMVRKKWYGRIGTNYFQLCAFVHPTSPSSLVTLEGMNFQIPRIPDDPLPAWHVLTSFHCLPEALYRCPLLSIKQIGPPEIGRHSVYRFDGRNFWFSVYDAENKSEADDLLSFLDRERFKGEYCSGPTYPADMYCQTYVLDGTKRERIRGDTSVSMALGIACDISIERNSPVEVCCTAGSQQRNWLVEHGRVVTSVPPCGF